MRKLIDADIKLLRKAEFRTEDSKGWSVSGSFQRVRTSNVWVYMHATHVSASNAEYNNFAHCLDVEKYREPYDYCRDRSNHYILQPFFSDNTSLQDDWEYEVSKAGEHEQLRALLQQLKSQMAGLMEEDLFSFQVCHNGCMWDENTWSKRLVGALRQHLPNQTATYTAEDGLKFKSKAASRSGLDSLELVKCFLFHGSTDITLKDSTLLAVEYPPPHDSQSSGDEKCIENGKKSDPIQEYPPKIGQLWACMHISIVEKCLRMFLQQKPITDKLGTNGMYINKSSGSSLASMEIPIVKVADNHVTVPRARLRVSEPRCSVLSAPSLCHALFLLTGATQCRNQTAPSSETIVTINESAAS